MTVAEHRAVLEYRCHYRTNTKSWTPGPGEPPRDTSSRARSRHEALFGCLQTDGTGGADKRRPDQWLTSMAGLPVRSTVTTPKSSQRVSADARNRPGLGGLLSITRFNQSGNRRPDERFDEIETFEAGQLVIPS